MFLINSKSNSLHYQYNKMKNTIIEKIIFLWLCTIGKRCILPSRYNITKICLAYEINLSKTSIFKKNFISLGKTFF